MTDKIFIGVRHDPAYDRWEAYISPNGHFKSIGFFNTAIEAAHAHDYDAAFIYGSGARLNFPRQELVFDTVSSRISNSTASGEARSDTRSSD